MDKLAEYLIRKETITGEEFMKIFCEVEGLPLPEKKTNPREEINRVKLDKGTPDRTQRNREDRNRDVYDPYNTGYGMQNPNGSGRRIYPQNQGGNAYTPRPNADGRKDSSQNSAGYGSYEPDPDGSLRAKDSQGKVYHSPVYPEDMGFEDYDYSDKAGDGESQSIFDDKN